MAEPNCSADKAITEVSEFGSTWRHSTALRDKPLARAVRTKSSRSTFSTAERVTRARMAACTTASEMAGSSKDCSAGHRPPPSSSLQPGKPPAENQLSLTENSKINKIANQKLGMAMPSWARPITPTSPQRLWWAAA